MLTEKNIYFPVSDSLPSATLILKIVFIFIYIHVNISAWPGLPGERGGLSVTLFQALGMEALNNVLAIHLLQAVVMEQAQVDVLPLPPAPYQPRVRRNRDDLFTLSDMEFKQNFRFTKDSVQKLVDLLQLRDR